MSDDAIALRHLGHFLRRSTVTWRSRALARPLRDFEPRRFPNRHFGSRVAYSALLSSPSFYGTFEA
jgi:hypothetical protein